MSIPINLTYEDFRKYINPYLSKAKRGYVSKIPLYKIFNYILYILHTGCQWAELQKAIDNRRDNPKKREISWQAVYYHFNKWSKDGSLRKVFEQSILFIKDKLNLSEINLDGTHTIAKKGGEEVAYQGRKKAKTSNILPVTDKNGNILATTEIVAGNHNDSFELDSNLKQIFRDIKTLGIDISEAYFNGDSAFDTKKSRKVCFNYDVIPNIYENTRNRKQTKRGRKRFFDKDIYYNRFTIERSFAWVDKFKRILIRFERKSILFLGFHFIAFAMVNLRLVT
jgi:transposase